MILTFLKNAEFFNSLRAFQRNGFQLLSQILEFIKALNHSTLNRHSVFLLIIQLGIKPIDFLLQQIKKPRRIMHLIFILLETLLQVL